MWLVPSVWIRHKTADGDAAPRISVPAVLPLMRVLHANNLSAAWPLGRGRTRDL